MQHAQWDGPEDGEMAMLFRKHTAAARRIQLQWRAREPPPRQGGLLMPMPEIEGSFLEAAPSADAEAMSAELTAAAARIQRQWRLRTEALHGSAAWVAARLIQTRWRGRALLLRCATKLQRQWRVAMARKRWQRLVVFGLMGNTSTFPAVSLIQRCWRKVRLRQRYGGIVQTLGDRYLPDKVKKGKHEANEWYTPAMNMRRERIWRSDRVQLALDRAWQATVACAVDGQREKAGRDRGGSAVADGTLGWYEYAEISRKIYLALTRRNDPVEALAFAKKDWRTDTKGGGKDAGMDRAAFYRSWFELADVHTKTMDEETCAPLPLPRCPPRAVPSRACAPAAALLLPS